MICNPLTQAVGLSVWSLIQVPGNLFKILEHYCGKTIFKFGSPWILCLIWCCASCEKSFSWQGMYSVRQNHSTAFSSTSNSLDFDCSSAVLCCRMWRVAVVWIPVVWPRVRSEGHSLDFLFPPHQTHAHLYRTSALRLSGCSIQGSAVLHHNMLLHQKKTWGNKASDWSNKSGRCENLW